MKTFTSLLTLSFSLVALQAHAEELRGNDALVLAAALNDIVMPSAAPAFERALNNQCEGSNAVGGSSHISVPQIECRASNVAVGSMSCIVNGKQITGRKAFELYALIRNVEGVDDGAAGTMYATTGLTTCSVDFGEIASCAGGGAVCTVTAPQR